MPEAAAEKNPPGPDLSETGSRIDALLDALGAGGPVVRQRAEELVGLVTDLYGAGLERLLELLHETGRLDDDLLGALTRDDLVSSLLLVHGLHPLGVEDRIEQALAGVRPYLGSHGGDVELLGVTQAGAVRLRLLGSCDGCPSSSVTLQLAVEGAIEAAAPEITSIEVEAASNSTDQHDPLISVESLRSRLIDPVELADPVEAPGHGAQWHRVPEWADLAAGAVSTVVVDGAAVLGCRIGATVFAFRDSCAACGAGLAGAVLTRRLGGGPGEAVLRCPACGTHYDPRRAGACLDRAELHLEPLPLLQTGSGPSVALPSPVLA